jgi:hypothetical protein
MYEKFEPIRSGMLKNRCVDNPTTQKPQSKSRAPSLAPGEFMIGKRLRVHLDAIAGPGWR